MSVQMLGVFAAFERAIIVERVYAGLRRARAQGKRLGRPRVAPEVEERIRRELRHPGHREEGRCGSRHGPENTRGGVSGAARRRARPQRSAEYRLGFKFLT